MSRFCDIFFSQLITFLNNFASSCVTRVTSIDHSKKQCIPCNSVVVQSQCLKKFKFTLKVTACSFVSPRFFYFRFVPLIYFIIIFVFSVLPRSLFFSFFLFFISVYTIERLEGIVSESDEH